MKKLIISTSCFVIVCLIFSFAILTKITNASEEYLDQNLSDEKSSKNSIYIVKNFNGNVAIFESEKSEPIKITEVYVNNLPYQDQQNLEIGISVESKEELNFLLEDLCS